MSAAITGDLTLDLAHHGPRWCQDTERVLELPAPAQRNGAQRELAASLHRDMRLSRRAVLAAHRDALYRAVTQDRHRFVPVQDLVYDVADAFPGLAPSRELVAVDEPRRLADKEGWELDQGLLLGALFDHEPSGRHLLHAMLLPTPASLSLLAEHCRRGRTELPKATVERQGAASVVTLHNERFLNAEDDTTVPSVETAVDLALLDPATEVCVLRGSVMDHPKFAERRVFCSGVNLTHIYHGKLSYLWYVKKDTGFTNKLLYGVARPDCDPESFEGVTEKAWIAVVEGFAIGGGCQYTLVCDYVLAAEDAYMTLPARKEGIVPGVANLRLPRLVGERMARQLVMYERRLDCASPEAALLCDRVVPVDQMDAALAETVDMLTGSGVVSTAANRRTLRVGTEALDLNRRYMAVYAEEQARCHFSPGLVHNLERFWNAAQRRP